MRWAVAGAVLLLCAPAVQADWLQEGYDAARTGNMPDAGPEWDDVALSLVVDKEGLAASATSGVVILGRFAYVAGMLTGAGAGFTSNVMKVGLDDGSVVRLATVDQLVDGLASDGRLLFVSGSGNVTALDIASGRIRWEQTVHASALPAEPLVPGGACIPPIITGDLVIVACSEIGYSFGDGFLVDARAFLRENGQVVWSWNATTSPPWPGQADPSDPVSFAGEVLTGLLSKGIGPPLAAVRCQASLLGGYVFLVVNAEHRFGFGGGVPQAEKARSAQLYAIAVADGAAASAAGRALVASAAALALDPIDPAGNNFMPAPTGDADRFFYKTGFLYRGPTADPVHGERDSLDVRQGAQADGDLGAGFAYDGESLYVTTATRLFRIGPDFRVDQAFGYSLPAGEIWDARGLVLADGILYGISIPPSDFNPFFQPRTLHAVDAVTGRALWSRGFQRPGAFGVSDGALVWIDNSHHMVVFGATAASLHPRLTASSDFPAPGAPVRVSLARTLPGLNGSAQEFAADWGDGTKTAWQREPILEHTYGTFGNTLARFMVRNPAGQTASIAHTFFVGGTPPDQTFLERSFDSQHQNATFFFLGLLATGLIALFGVLASRRRRSRLHRELAAIDAAFQRTRNDRVACEAALAERKAHVGGLMLDHRITEDQLAVLERRIDDCLRLLRVASIDERLYFLPHGLILRLQQMLSDGRLNAYEEREFLAAIARESRLTTKERDAVRGVLRSWGSARPA